MINSLFICSYIGASLPCYALVKYTSFRDFPIDRLDLASSTHQSIDTMVKTRIGAVGPCALLGLVLLLAGSCVCVQAADEQTSGGGRRRRAHRRSAAAVADMMVPITFLNASVEKGAGMSKSKHGPVNSLFASSCSPAPFFSFCGGILLLFGVCYGKWHLVCLVDSAAS